MHRTILLAVMLTAVVVAMPAAAQDAAPKPVYLAVGDSLTRGLYASEGHGWAYMVADALPGYTLEVVPAPGIDNAIDFLPAELADHAPQLVTIEVGINNINYTDGGMPVATFLARYVAMLSILKDANTPRVVACTVPWTAEVPGSIQYERALQFNAVINFAVPMFGYEVADCWGATVERWDYLSPIDKFHPNDAGHRAIADAALRAILPPVHFLPAVSR